MTPHFERQMQRLNGLKFVPATLETHWEGLYDLTAEELDAAVSCAIRECDEFPSPRMLRSLVPRADSRGHIPPCRTHTECLKRVLAS